MDFYLNVENDRVYKRRATASMNISIEIKFTPEQLVRISEMFEVTEPCYAIVPGSRFVCDSVSSDVEDTKIKKVNWKKEGF